jgi:ribonuclease HI
VTTNNKMELTGAIEALSRLQGTSGPVAIYTDSTYVIQGIRGWVHGWKRRGWKTAAGTDVLNRELVGAAGRARVGARPRALSWHYVRGHVGIPGNERVDEIADSFAVQRPVALYDGPLVRLPGAILDLPGDTTVPPRHPSSGSGASSKAPAYSYLSVVDGKPMRHATWSECEQRVKGRSGARFKKAASPPTRRRSSGPGGSSPTTCEAPRGLPTGAAADTRVRGAMVGDRLLDAARRPE